MSSFRILLSFIVTLLIVSCGGVGGQVHANKKSEVHLIIHWPEVASRFIHDRANKITASLSQNGTEFYTKSISRPSGGGSSDLVLTDIPPDKPIAFDVWSEDTNLNSQAGHIVRLSEAKMVTTLTPGPNQLDFALESNTASLQISGVPSSPMQIGDLIHLTAVAKNSDGVIILSSPDAFAWSSSSPLVVSLDSFGTTVGIQNGTSVITVREKGNESSHSFSNFVSITVGNTLPTTYQLVELAPGHTYSRVTGINGDGTICGYLYDSPNNINYSFKYKFGTGIQMLDTTQIAGFTGSQAMAINDLGDILGTAYSNQRPPSAFVWNHDGTSSYPPHTAESYALSINASGAFTGVYRELFFDDFGPTIWSSFTAQPQQLRTSTLGSAAYVANSGHIAWWNGSDATASVGIPGSATSLTSISNTKPIVLGLNNSDSVVGYGSPSSGATFACVWDQQGRADLGLGQANGINDSGVAVGVTTQSNGGFASAFIWTRAGGLKNLTQMIQGSAGWANIIPFGINKNGWIIAEGEKNGQGAACLLIPQ